MIVARLHSDPPTQARSPRAAIIDAVKQAIGKIDGEIGRANADARPQASAALTRIVSDLDAALKEFIAQTNGGK